MRRYRMNRDRDPQKRTQYLEKEKLRNSSRRANIIDMSRRDKKSQRSKWREIKRKQRQKLKDVEQLMTPPMSPNEDQPIPGPSRQRQQARRRRREERKASQRKVEDLQKKLTVEKKRIEMLRKRIQRNKNKTMTGEGTPRTRTNRTMKYSSLKTVRKTLLFHNVLMDQLRNSYKQSSKKYKRSFSQTLAGKVLQKYRMRTHAAKSLRIKTRTNLKTRTCLIRRTKQKIQNFFERDDNSRITSGKKETVTFRKVRKQKRLLTDNVRNLFRKFQSENPNCHMSLTSFRRMKPFWIRKATEYERDTCLCKIHDNFRLVTEKLHSLHVLNDSNPDNVVKKTACDINNKTCMYGECQKCCDYELNISDKDQNQTVSWLHWTHMRVKREIKNCGVKDVFITTKKEESGYLSDLVQSFQDQIPKFKRHFYNMKNQFLHHRNILRDLNDKECILHVDFAENYQGKLDSEIQAMHFGASKTQITLHTGILYTKDCHKTFCTVSDSLEHGPAAIWAHLLPLLKDVRKEAPSIDTIHFYSDGPTSQYRQKGNFYHFSSLPFTLGFKHLDWNYFESGHGKGAPDGIGGALKRRADDIVRCGTSIADVATFVSKLEEAKTSVKLFLINENDIQAIEKLKKFSSLDPVPGTMRIHQVISESPHTMYYRDVSCSCTHISPCKNHECNRFMFPEKRSRVKLETSETSGKKSKLEEEIEENGMSSRRQYFENILEELCDCCTYQDLQNKCKSVAEMMEYTVQCEQQTIVSTGLKVDRQAKQIYPNDAPVQFCPVKVSADGNCLPHTASVFAFGDELSHEEMRARIVIELVNNEDLYLSQNHLIKGLSPTVKVPQSLAANYCLYSEHYIAGVHMTTAVIHTVFRDEIMSIRKSRTYMGIWQLHALSSILGVKIFSVYPQLGNKGVREHLHRLILPQTKCSRTDIIQIMWTSTRTQELTREHWLPNHFVPALPYTTPPEPATTSTTPPEPATTLTTPHVSEPANTSTPPPEPATASTTLPELATASTTPPEPAIASTTPPEPATASTTPPEPATASTTPPEPATTLTTPHEPANTSTTPPEPAITPEPATASTTPAELATASTTPPEPATASTTPPEPATASTTPPEPATASTTPPEPATASTTPPEPATASTTPLEPATASTTPPEPATYEALKRDLPMPETLLDKYVIVSYDGNAYPGRVLEYDEQNEVYVECMHHITHESNCFFWPRFKDRCWYDYDISVLACIPEPLPIKGKENSRHREVDPKIWNMVKKHMLTANVQNETVDNN
ncbi:uncharacterized protein LOC126810751 [Patella vulgata]|uniref:uncharacterized protein LOC126810751 n=1 Tax=Patella vulgata TaxID=6465 RepID=UPI0024A88AEF|nr:uncharacterized protein LOC126810751 [Patella vulgata]